MKKSIAPTLLLACIPLFAVSCDDDDLGDAGDNLEDAANDVGDEVDDLADDVDDAAEEGADNVEDAVDDHK